jgi:DNA-binding IclR family transcriptional regulator
MGRSFGLFEEARFRLLRALYWAPDGVSVRELSYRTGISLHAVQNALQSLRRLEFVLREKAGQRVIYCLNQEHHEFKVVEQLVRSLVEYETASLAQRDSKTNENAVKLLSQMHSFAGKIKQGGLRRTV